MTIFLSDIQLATYATGNSGGKGNLRNGTTVKTQNRKKDKKKIGIGQDAKAVGLNTLTGVGAGLAAPAMIERPFVALNKNKWLSGKDISETARKAVGKPLPLQQNFKFQGRLATATGLTVGGLTVLNRWKQRKKRSK